MVLQASARDVAQAEQKGLPAQQRNGPHSGALSTRIGYSECSHRERPNRKVCLRDGCCNGPDSQPSPGADVGGVSPVGPQTVQMWQRRRAGPVPTQMWQG